MNRSTRISLIGMTLLVSGCSVRQGYDFVQEAGEARAACERELTVAAQRACEEAYQIEYGDYRRARQAVLESPRDD